MFNINLNTEDLTLLSALIDVKINELKKEKNSTEHLEKLSQKILSQAFKNKNNLS